MSNDKFNTKETKIKGVVVIEPLVRQDNRGFFMESYNFNDFLKLQLARLFVQDNHSLSHKGILRGMHYQNNPSPMGKLVKVITGEIFDVGVDIRKNSPTYGQWVGEYLSGRNNKMMYFPPGIAHGFLSVENKTNVIYKCTGTYSEKDEAAISPFDPEIGIDWPLDRIRGMRFCVQSERDKNHPKLSEAINNHV